MSTMSSRHAKLLESFSDSEEMPLLREFTDLACPGYSHLLPHQSQNPTSNVLLIVAMNSVTASSLDYLQLQPTVVDIHYFVVNLCDRCAMT